MRFLYYDRVLRIEPGQSIVGVKTFTLSEEFLRGHFRRTALVPGVIFIEAMAQLLGWLIILTHGFELSAVMSLIESVRVPAALRPGFQAEIRGEILSTSRRDSLGRARVLIDGEEVATLGRIIYTHSSRANPEQLKRLFNYYSGMNPDQPTGTVEG